MDKTIFVLLDACQYEAASKYLGYLEHMIDYNKGAKYKVLGELPSLSKPMYATLFTGLPVCKHGVTCNEVGGVLPYDSVFSLCRKAGGRLGRRENFRIRHCKANGGMSTCALSEYSRGRRVFGGAQ